MQSMGDDRQPLDLHVRHGPCQKGQQAGLLLTPAAKMPGEVVQTMLQAEVQLHKGFRTSNGLDMNTTSSGLVRRSLDSIDSIATIRRTKFYVLGALSAVNEVP